MIPRSKTIHQKLQETGKLLGRMANYTLWLYNDLKIAVDEFSGIITIIVEDNKDDIQQEEHKD